MARSRSTLLAIGSVVTAVTVLATACDVPMLARGGGQPAAEPTVIPRTSASQSRPTVEVRRGTITDSIKVLGRVISSQEADLYFRRQGRLRGLQVESGQQVQAGQLMAELETGDLLTNIGKAKSTLENAQIKLEQARAKGALDETADEASGVEVARINLDQARLQLDKLRSAVPEAEIRAAEAAVVKASADLEKARVDLAQKESELAAAQAELAFKQTPPSAADLADQQAKVETARIKLEQATAGPRPEEGQAAELKVEQARTK